MLRIQLLLITIALFVSIELLYTSICRLPSNRANGVTGFEDIPILYIASFGYGFLIQKKLQWLEHLWDHENMFETGVVRANEY